MNFVTVDAKRRVTLPKDMHVKPGQVLGVEVRDGHADFYPVQVLPMDEFRRVMELIGEEYKEEFARLAK